MESGNLKFVKKFSTPQESLSVKNLKTKTLYILDPLTQHANADLANKASSQISFLRKKFDYSKGLTTGSIQKVFKKGLSKRKKTLFQMTLFEEFCIIIMLNFRMSGAVSLHLIFICLRYALFPVQSN